MPAGNGSGQKWQEQTTYLNGDERGEFMGSFLLHKICTRFYYVATEKLSPGDGKDGGDGRSSTVRSTGSILSSLGRRQSVPEDNNGGGGQERGSILNC